MYRCSIVPLALLLMACSSQSETADSTAAATTSSSSGGDGGAGGSGEGGAGGGGGAAPSCPDPTNPLFGSCTEAFLLGCFEPDLSGSCTDMDGTVSWSDGSKYVTSGNQPGLYGPGDAVPCIAVVFADGSITATKGAEMLVYVTDSATETATITCPDGSSFTASYDQVTAFNRCVGVNCP